MNAHDRAELSHARSGAKTYIKFHARPSSEVMKAIASESNLHSEAYASFMSEYVAAKQEGQYRALCDDEKRDVLSMLHRTEGKLTVAHAEHISKMLELKRRSLVVYLIEEVYPGKGSISKCNCGREYPRLHSHETKCATCNLAS